MRALTQQESIHANTHKHARCKLPEASDFNDKLLDSLKPFVITGDLRDTLDGIKNQIGNIEVCLCSGKEASLRCVCAQDTRHHQGMCAQGRRHH